LKLAFHLPRPYWIDRRVLALAAESSYGLPSGHAQDAVAIWGFVAAQLRRPWAWAAALVLVLLISLSRVYLGVHFPTDVLGGWVSGGILLFAFVRWEQPVTAWLRRLNLWPQIALAFGLSLVYLALTGGALALISRRLIRRNGSNRRGRRSAEDRSAPTPTPKRRRGYRGGLIFGLGAALASLLATRFNARRGPNARRGSSPASPASDPLARAGARISRRAVLAGGDFPLRALRTHDFLGAVSGPVGVLENQPGRATVGLRIQAEFSTRKESLPWNSYAKRSCAPPRP
jgi:hypothetical protein